MNISASITDFPVFSHIETFFKEFKNAGLDGVEIVLGAKSRFFKKQILTLVDKYNLPVTSVHQPPWSGVGLYFDKEFGNWAKTIGTTSLVCHPLAFQSFESTAMKKYFQQLATLQEQYNMHILLENMPNDFAYQKLHTDKNNTMTTHLEKIGNIADEYGFLLTYDVSHAEFIDPQKEEIFQKIFPKIGNIHLSSFQNHQHHLPLTMGDLDAAGFLQYLKNKKYKGIITFEVYYPRLRMMINNYDFSAIYNSVKVFRSLTDKFS